MSSAGKSAIGWVIPARRGSRATITRFTRHSNCGQLSVGRSYTNRAPFSEQADVGLGEFDPEADIAKLDIPALAERIQKVAPELWQLLGALMQPQSARSHRDTLVEYQGSM